MKTRRLFRGLIAVLLTMVISIFIINCIPPSTATTEGDESVISAEKARQDSLRNLDCERYLSFAYSYYQNQNWSGAISNFKKMVDLGCDEDYARDIFAYYGRSYQQLAKEDPVYYDSALFVYIEGEKYLPDNEFLHKNMAYIYHIQGKVDLELREYEKLVDINPDDIELYRNLVKLYFSSEKYEDALWPIEEILRIDPNDEQAVNDRMIAFDRMGKDIIDVQREQWEKNPDNIRYGMEYAFSLQDRLEYESAIEVYKRIAAIDNGNREVWENLGRLYTALDRTEDALNLISVRIVQELISPASVIETARRMHLTTKMSPVDAIALGSEAVIPLEITSAYGIFANHGIWVEPIAITKIEDRYGNTVAEYTPKQDLIFSEETAYLVTNLLETVINKGTGKNSRNVFGFRHTAAGKTGTTNNFSDAWFVGYTPRIVAGVWVGVDNPGVSLGRGESGARAALPVWANFMKQVHKEMNWRDTKFIRPPGIVEVNICRDTKLLPSKYCPIETELFTKKTAPTQHCPLHRDIVEPEVKDRVIF